MLPSWSYCERNIPCLISFPSESMKLISSAFVSLSSNPFVFPLAGAPGGTKAGTSKHMKCAKKELYNTVRMDSHP